MNSTLTNQLQEALKLFCEIRHFMTATDSISNYNDDICRDVAARAEKYIFSLEELINSCAIDDQELLTSLNEVKSLMASYTTNV